MFVHQVARMNVHNFMYTPSQLTNEVYQKTVKAIEAGQAEREAIQNEDMLRARKEKVRAAFLEGMGGLPESAPDLNPQITGTIQYDGWHIDKLIFTSRPNTYVTANIYVPEKAPRPLPAVLLVCGHGYEAKAYDPYQMVCRKLVAQGLLVLAIDPIGQGERLSYLEEDNNRQTVVRWGTGEHDYAGWQLLMTGKSLARYFLHDAMRAIDYLLTRPDVDPARIGVTGQSGGGTQTMLLMMAEDRIAAAAPCTFFTSRVEYMYSGGAQDAEQIWNGMEKVGFDHEDALLCMAPRPTLVLTVTQDFFPLEGSKRAVASAKRILSRLGMGDTIEFAEDDSLHEYTPALADKAAEFFARHLKAVCPVEGVSCAPIDPKLLNCTPSGQVHWDYPDSRIVFDETRDLADAIAPQPDLLRHLVLDGREKCDLNRRVISEDRIDVLRVQNTFYFSRPGVCGSALVFTDYRCKGECKPVLAIWDDGTTALKDHIHWIRSQCAQGKRVFVVNLSGMGPLTPDRLNQHGPNDPEGAVYKLAHDLLWLDDSLPAVRTYDVLRALEMIAAWPDTSAEVEVYARGVAAFYVQLAARLDERLAGGDVECPLPDPREVAKQKYYLTDGVHEWIFPGLLSVL